MPYITSKDEFEIEIHQKIDVNQIIIESIQKYGAKKVLEKLGFWSSFLSMPNVTTMLCLISTKQDVENVETGIIIKYILDNWCYVRKRALKHWTKYIRKNHPESTLHSNSTRKGDSRNGTVKTQ